MKHIPIEFPEAWTQYELLDSGSGEKLERFGSYTVARPDPRILWEKRLTTQECEKADAFYERIGATQGQWSTRRQPPEPWILSYNYLKLLLKPTEFKHVGVFPEQAVNWDWLTSQCTDKKLQVLNLFGYTGAATITAAAAGASVTHVDSSKSTIAWARENAALSGVATQPIRWMEDDAYKFVLRDGRREQKYDGIIMDPPRFGRGSKGEVWKLETDLPKLLVACRAILSDHPQFILMNAYTADLSSLVLHHLLSDFTRELGGIISFGELTIKEKNSDRLLPHGIFARWSRT